MIYIQEEDFALDEAYQKLREKTPEKTGAICTFTGLVRDFGDGSELTGIALEHYPGMTEKSLTAIVEEAHRRWKLIDSLVIHRVGRLYISDQIVFVGVSASHRADAFAAAEFIMDFLKTKAPFWKKELKGKQETWVEAKKSDVERSLKWSKED